MSVILQPSVMKWACPNCTEYAVTVGQANRFHNCRALAGLAVPMVPAGTRCKVEMREREDYVGTEDVQYDGNGRPVMSVVTTRDDGQDCAVYAPTAHIVRSD